MMIREIAIKNTPENAALIISGRQTSNKKIRRVKECPYQTDTTHRLAGCILKN
jgi:hypothetical protein